MNRPIDILMIEDNPADVALAREALKDAESRVNMQAVEDGCEAMDFLRKKGKYKGSAYPDLILLDLNLPGKDGREVLKEIKADPRLKHTPVVVLTTSQAQEDVCKSYELQASCFITKPVDFDEFIKVIKSIESFWFTVARLPHENC